MATSLRCARTSVCLPLVAYVLAPCFLLGLPWQIQRSLELATVTVLCHCIVSLYCVTVIAGYCAGYCGTVAVGAQGSAPEIRRSLQLAFVPSLTPWVCCPLQAVVPRPFSCLLSPAPVLCLALASPVLGTRRLWRGCATASWASPRARTRAMSHMSCPPMSPSPRSR